MTHTIIRRWFALAAVGMLLTTALAPSRADAHMLGRIGRDTINLASNCRRHVPLSQRAECLVCTATPRMHYHRGLPPGMRCHPVNAR